MAFNFGKLKAVGVPNVGARISKLVKDRKLKPMAFKKVNVLKDKVNKDFNFNKLTKKADLPKSPKIALIKKAIKKIKK